MHLEREKSPLHILLEMNDMQGCEYLIEEKEDGMITIFPSSGGYLDGVALNFEHFARFVWENNLNFVGNGRQPVPAFTSIVVVCEDLKDEKYITRVYHLEERRMYWYIPQRGIFVHDKGTVTPNEMPVGSYIYEPFSQGEEMTGDFSEKIIRFWIEVLPYEDPENFIGQFGVTREQYNWAESVCRRIPQATEAVGKMYPWFKEKWRAAFLIYMLI